MKSTLGVLVVVGVLAVVPVATQNEQTWKGTISDSNCNEKHMFGGDAKKNTDCTTACIKKGAKYVFVSDGKVYKITNQRSKTIASHAGQQVALTGTMEGDTITVKTIATTVTK